MPPSPLRFLLDQGFPKPVIRVEELDATVQYVHLSDWRPELARTSTPDWIVHLAAESDGLTGIVTGDYHSVDQVEEAIALERTRLTVVTWRKGINNPVVQWGSLLAYMPAIRAAISQRGPCIVTLPVPRLSKDQIHATAGAGTRYFTHHRVSKDDKAAIRAEMMTELQDRALPGLIELLQSNPRRGKRRPRPTSAADPTPELRLD